MTERQGRVGLALRGYRLGRKIRQVEMARQVGMTAQRLNRIEMSKVKPTAQEVHEILSVVDLARWKFLTLLFLLNDLEPEEAMEWALPNMLANAWDGESDKMLKSGVTVRMKRVNGRIMSCVLNEKKCVDSGMAAEVDKVFEAYAASEHSPA